MCSAGLFDIFFRLDLSCCFKEASSESERMSSDPQFVVAFPLDIGSTIAEEFLVHPDLYVFFDPLQCMPFIRLPTSRVIAGFLLGWVFWSGISHACRSQFFQVLGRLCWNFLRNTRVPSNSSDIEARSSQHQDVEKNPQRRRSQLSTIHRISNQAALTFTLNLCFAFAGFAEFCSLLVYDSYGVTACGRPHPCLGDAVLITVH